MTYDTIRTLFYQLTKNNVNSLSNSVLNSYTQPAEDEIAALIMNADNRWQFDDSNLTDLPQATAALVSGQQDYSLATSHLTIDRVEIKDTSGYWWLLKPIDQHDIRFTALAQYYPTNGRPLEYDKIGNSIFLYPIPNYSQSASLKIYFTRGPLKFDYNLGTFTDSSGSTSSSPGYNSLFHELVALKAARRFAVANGRENKADILQDIQLLEQKLNDFYGLRSHDERPRIGVSTNGTMQGNQSGVLSRGANDSNK